MFFTNSGTEANEAALLVATNYRRSNQILAVRNSYHGRSYAAMGITGHRSWSSSSLNPLQVSWLHSGDRLRGLLARLDEDEHIEAAVDDLREVLATQTAGDVAALIAEPMQGVGGFVSAPDGLLGALKKVLDETGILLISDEVQTGWGRTGEHFWGYQAHGVVPDLLTFAKGIGNGFALAGVVGRAEVMNERRRRSPSPRSAATRSRRPPATRCSTTCSTTTCRATRPAWARSCAPGCASAVGRAARSWPRSAARA